MVNIVGHLTCFLAVLQLASLNPNDPFDLAKVILNHAPGPCQYLQGIDHGSEDAAVLPNGMAILSTGLQFSRTLSTPNVKPGFMSFNFASPNEPPKPLQVTGFSGFLNPHGLSIHQEGERTFVYAVNHPEFNEHPPADTVEKFLWQVDRGVLVHQKSFTDPTFAVLNDLVVTGEDKFYTSNFQIFTNPMMQLIELVLANVPLQNVVYFNGTKGTVVIEDSFGPQGLGVSADKTFLYLNEFNSRTVSSFSIDSPTQLRKVDSYAIDGSVDNLDVDLETGDLWVAAHPVGYKSVKKMLTGLGKTPALVTRLSVNNGRFMSSKEVFSDDGSNLSGSSVAVHSRGWVLIGTLIDKALLCRCLEC